MNNETRPWLDGVEGEAARELIESNAPVICVVAGPGSGKTFCLKRRTWRLVEGDGINIISARIAVRNSQSVPELSLSDLTFLCTSGSSPYTYWRHPVKVSVAYGWQNS